MSRAASQVPLAHQSSQTIAVAHGASLNELTSACRAGETLSASDLQPAWIIVSLISAATCFIFWRLPPDAGAEVSRRQTAATSGSTDASDQKQG
jgi:hypothetical protein